MTVYTPASMMGFKIATMPSASSGVASRTSTRIVVFQRSRAGLRRCEKLARQVALSHAVRVARTWSDCGAIFAFDAGDLGAAQSTWKLRRTRPSQVATAAPPKVLIQGGPHVPSLSARVRHR